MSRVVFLPPQPEQRHNRSVLARLRSLLRRAPTPACGADSGVGPVRGELSVRRRRYHAARSIVEAAGTLDVRTRGSLVQALEEALEEDGAEIVLDLGDLETIDHAGLDAVLTAHQRASDQLKPLVIVPGPAPVQRVFDDARVPFLYASEQVGRAARRRSRGRRTVLSARPGPRPRSERRSGKPPEAWVAKGSRVVSWQISNTRCTCAGPGMIAMWTSRSEQSLAAVTTTWIALESMKLTWLRSSTTH